MRHAHPTLQKAIKRELLLFEGIQQEEFDTVMSIEMATENDHLRQQRIANIMCFNCRQKRHYKKLDEPLWSQYAITTV